MLNLKPQRSSNIKLPTATVSLSKGHSISHHFSVYKLSLCDGVKPVPLSDLEAICFLQEATSAAHPVLGKLLLKKLHAVTAGTSMEVALADASLCVSYRSIDVQLWVLKW